jgi:hypothetical protein
MATKGSLKTSYLSRLEYTPHYQFAIEIYTFCGNWSSKITGETVEKVPKRTLGRDAEKSDLIECASINDLMPGEGQVTPQTTP